MTGAGSTSMVVVGGGIGGLATAVAAARNGVQVTVLERSPEFTELGAGIQIAPNGLHALDRLGLGDRVRDRAVHIGELRFLDGLTGEHVTSLPLTEVYRERFGNAYVVVHRGDLYGLLLEACRESNSVSLRAGSPVTGYRQDADHAAVALPDGEWVAGDVVVGADGVHSAIRRQLLADGEPRIAGITVYRSLVPIEEVPEDLQWNAVTWWTGPGRHFVHYPIAGGRFLNLAPSHESGATEAIANAPVEADHVRELFAGFAPSAQRMLALGRDWRSWVLVDRDPALTWTDGRVALLGDAAHPMLHYVAQGACQALEDAVVLTDLLEAADQPVADLLHRYAAARQGRTAAITHAARQSIRLWHCAGAGAQARNRALSGMSVTELHDQVAWMHGARDFGAAEPVGVTAALGQA